MRGMKMRDDVWDRILASRYPEGKTPSLDDKNFMKSLRSLTNTFFRDYSHVTRRTDTKRRRKPFHFHGTCFKFRYIPETSGDGVLRNEQHGIVRLSLVEPRSPTLGIKFYLDEPAIEGDPPIEDLVMVPHQNEQEDPMPFRGMEDTFGNIVYRTWFDVPIHRHNNVNIIQAMTFPIFREVSKVFSVKFHHLFAEGEAPRILNLIPNKEMTIAGISPNKEVMRFHSEDGLVGRVVAESVAVQSEYGDMNLHFQHRLVNPLRSLHPLSLIPRWIEIATIIPTTLLRNRTPLTPQYIVAMLLVRRWYKKRKR